MNVEDFFSKFRKRITFNYDRFKLFFDVNQLIFSSIYVDKGTLHLLNSFRKTCNVNYGRILDVGCGYGSIGIYLKKKYFDSYVECVDRDALSLEFCQHNAILNNCNINVHPSLGYNSVDGKFDLICSNYPAKAGKNALKDFVYNASRFLEKDGVLAIVIVKELVEDFKDILKDEIQIIYEEASSGHVVYHIKFSDVLNFDENNYSRGNNEFIIGNEKYILDCAYNIAEFEDISFSSCAIIEILKNLSTKKIDVIRPFQGYLPLAISYYLKPEKINLISRDLLSLTFSSKNLETFGFKNIRIFHQFLSDNRKGELLVWNVDKELEFEQFKFEIAMVLKNFDTVVIGGKKSKLMRFMKDSGIDYSKKIEIKNAVALILKS